MLACRSLTLCLLSFAAVTAHAQAHPSAGKHPILLVVNKGDRNIALMDPATGRITATIPTGGITAHEVTSSPDGRYAYAPIYGDSGVGKPGTNGTFVAVIDLQQARVTGRIDFGHGVRPHFPIYDSKRNLLYISTELENSISIIDPATLKSIGSIDTGKPESHMFITAHDGKHAYTANVASGTVSILDLDTRKLLGIIPVAEKVQRITISPDDRTLYTSDVVKAQLDTIDTATHQITRTQLSAAGYGAAPTPDGKFLLIAMPTANQVAVVDLQANKVTRTIDVCALPQEVVLNPADPNLAYVSCMSANGQVGILDLAAGRMRNAVNTGQTTDGLGWATTR